MASCGLRAGLFVGRVQLLCEVIVPGQEIIWYIIPQSQWDVFTPQFWHTVNLKVEKVRKTINPEITIMHIHLICMSQSFEQLIILSLLGHSEVIGYIFESNKCVRFYSVADIAATPLQRRSRLQLHRAQWSVRYLMSSLKLIANDR